MQIWANFAEPFNLCRETNRKCLKIWYETSSVRVLFANVKQHNWLFAGHTTKIENNLSGILAKFDIYICRRQ